MLKRIIVLLTVAALMAAMVAASAVPASAEMPAEFPAGSVLLERDFGVDLPFGDLDDGPWDDWGDFSGSG